MEDTMKNFIHDELLDINNKVTSDFCAHIYIAKKDELFIVDETELLVHGNHNPIMRSATLTFIEYEGKSYGITCSHVLNSLKLKNDKNDKELKKYCKGPLPPIAKYHFYVSIGDTQHHVNANFYKIEAGYGVIQPDLAIALLPDNFVLSIGRKCIKHNKICLPSTTDRLNPNLTGIACGYPEYNRTIIKSHVPSMKDFGKGYVVLTAKFDSIADHSIRIMDDIIETNGVNNLSGMSGGPLFWSTKTSWGLAGIIKDGGDLNPRVQLQDTEYETNPTINVLAEPLTMEGVKEWFNQLPCEKFPELLSTTMYIPSGFKGFKKKQSDE